MIRAIIVVLALATIGCGDVGRQIQIRTANATAVGANAALPMLVDRYRSESLAAIDRAETREVAEAKLSAIDRQWDPIWEAWDALATAQDAWASSLESDGDTAAALAALRIAYCGIRNLWPSSIPAIPLSLVSCEVSP